MRVPGARFALVDERKVKEYPLAPSHPDGASKARFFSTFGFRRETWRWLATALRQHVADQHFERRVASQHGVKYIVRGALRASGRSSPQVITVWIVARGERRPRFVTAYPGGKR